MPGTHDPLAGRVLDGRFRLEERIGVGGMGAVYRARQLNVDRDVAIKLLHPMAADDPEHVRRFENEARIIAQLRDPHTLKLIDFGRMEDGQLYIVMEHLAGRSLKQFLKEEGPLEASVALGLLRQICDALAEAHAAGVVHRDLKPGNLFVERVGHRDVLKVLDFGIARWSRAGGDATTGPIHGTPEYMSPEQARGEKVDGRSDLYSLGVVAYECLAGAPVFESETAMGLLLKHLQDPPPPFDVRQPPVEVDLEVEALVMRLLEKSPEHRPADALELATEIDRLLAGGAPRAAGAPGLLVDAHAETLPPEATEPSRWPWMAALVLGIAAIGWLFWPGPVAVAPDVGVVVVPKPVEVDAAAVAVVTDAAPAPPLDAAPVVVEDAAKPRRRQRPPRRRARRSRPRPPPPDAAARIRDAAPPRAPDAARPPGPFIRVVPKPE